MSIEWFLDTTIKEEEPTVRWTSYDSELDRYQGELIGKEAYVRDFLTATKRPDGRTWPKLELLWSHLLAVCSAQNS